MSGVFLAWLRRLGRWFEQPSFHEQLERELRNGDAVRLRVTTLERSLGRSNQDLAGSESPASLRTNLNRG